MTGRNLLASAAVCAIVLVLPVALLHLNAWHRQATRQAEPDPRIYNEW